MVVLGWVLAGLLAYFLIGALVAAMEIDKWNDEDAGILVMVWPMALLDNFPTRLGRTIRRMVRAYRSRRG